MRLLLVFGALLAVVAAVAVVVASSGSSSGVKVPTIPPAAVRSGTPPRPPRGALVLAQGHGDLAVALAARRAGSQLRLTGTIVASDGTGLTGLRVRFAVAGRQLPVAGPCGPGCYASSTRASSPPRRVSLTLSGRGRSPSTVVFALPEHWPVSAAPLLRGAERVFRSLRGVVYDERLSSGPRVTDTSVWRTEAPDRLSYRSSAGDAGVVIGKMRWDLVVGGGWKRSLQNPPLVMPSPPWGAGAYDVNLLGGGRLGGRQIVRFSMFEPTTPAWYTVTLERSTLRTLNVSMTAAAHFMVNRYVAFNSPRQIRPPVSG
ncbi:MAG TPA: hypothetical protein VFD90_08810 [Gaiellales bacterium]|jgi:hypothetical protein|nr:hypothetical protein [Gaiellales bacterium]